MGTGARGKVARISILLSSLLCSFLPVRCKAQRSNLPIQINCAIKPAYPDYPLQTSSSTYLTKFFWCFDQPESSRQREIIQVHLRSPSDSFQNLAKVSDLLYSRGLSPVPSTDEGLLLEAGEKRFDKATHSWKFELQLDRRKSPHMIITANRQDTVSLGYLIAQSLLTTSKAASGVEGGVNEFVLMSAQQTFNPNVVLLLMKWDEEPKLMTCHFRRKSMARCNVLVIPKIFEKPTAGLTLEVTHSALTSAILWDANRFVQVVGSRQWSRQLPFNVAHVSFNGDKTTWIVQCEGGMTYFGRLHLPDMSRIVLPHSHEPFAAVFLEGGKIRQIRWSGNTTESAQLEIKDFNLAEVIEGLPQRGDASEVFLRSFYRRNVMDIESLQDSFSVALNIFTSSVNDCTCEMYYDFQNLTLRHHVEQSVLTRRVSLGTVARNKAVDVNVAANCTDSPESCETGYALLEIACQSSTAVQALHAFSNILLINMTCPSGLKLHLAEERDKARCWDHGAICRLNIREGDHLYLNFETFNFEKFLSVVEDDILLTELTNRTGFTIHNFNLLKKACYPCSNLKEAGSNSQLTLQTMKSACPCIATAENAKRWIGNISFENTYPTSGPNVFHFSAEALSNSLCDLKTEFIVELVRDPSLNFLSLEYVFLLVCVFVTAASLCISYHKYIMHMRMNREKRNMGAVL